MAHTLEHILRELSDSCIMAGAEVLAEGALRLWIGDQARGVRAQTVIGSPNVYGATNWSKSPAALRWLHETAVRLYPESPYASAHSGDRPPRLGVAA
jgi:hypothetical protein